MKKTKLISSIILLLSFFISEKAYTQDTIATNKNFKFGIGVGAGFTTGTGLSFRYTPSKFGMQLNFAPYKSESTELYSVGLTFIYKIIEDKNVNFFLYQGNHYQYESRADYYYDPFNSSSPYRYYHEGVNNGLGFGFEFIFAKRMSFNIMTGYAAYNNFRGLDLTIETGLYYNFR